MSHGIPDLRSLYAAAIGHSTSDGVLESEEQARLMERFQLVLSELDRFRSASARAQRMELDRIQTKFQAGMGRPGLKTRETSPPEKSTSPRPPARQCRLRLASFIAAAWYSQWRNCRSPWKRRRPSRKCVSTSRQTDCARSPADSRARTKAPARRSR